jgi:hypothetical protein
VPDAVIGLKVNGLAVLRPRVEITDDLHGLRIRRPDCETAPCLSLGRAAVRSQQLVGMIIATFEE